MTLAPLERRANVPTTANLANRYVNERTVKTKQKLCSYLGRSIRSEIIGNYFWKISIAEVDFIMQS